MKPGAGGKAPVVPAIQGVKIRKAAREDCRVIADPGLMAEEGSPAYFREQSRNAGQTIEAVGTPYAASETEKYSCRNVQPGVIDHVIAGTLLA